VFADEGTTPLGEAQRDVSRWSDGGNVLDWLRWEIRFGDTVLWGIAPHVHYDLNPYWN
jgi:hypothetical protein